MNKILFFLFLLVLCALMYISKSFLVISFGVCIFLYAMIVLENSFSMFAGIESFLKKATSSKISSFNFGLLTTAIMQSSGLVSVLAISFLSAGLISLISGLAIIYGANLGTVTGAWLVAGLGLKVDIASYAMPLIVVGMLFIFNKSDKIKGCGYFLFSIGLLFLGIAYMKSGFDNIKDTIDLSKYAMSGVSGLLVYTLIGLIMTVVMQSSHATLTLAITALGANQITYENSVAIAIGSNVGSTIMAIIGSFNANSEGKKLTVAHVIFNVTSAIITLIFINFFIFITDETAKIAGVRDDDYTIKLAIFHTYFNVTGVLLFYPLANLMEKLLNKFIKSEHKRSKVDTAYYLNEDSAQFSDSATEVLVKEVKHLYSNASSIIAKSISISKEDINSPLSPEEVIRSRQQPIKMDFDKLYNNRFKEIYSQIIDFAVLASSNSKKEDMGKFMDLRRVALLLAEALKDIKNSQPNVYKFITSNNPYIKTEYDKLRIKLLKSLRIMAKMANLKDDYDLKTELKELKEIYNDYSNDELALDTLLGGKKISNTMATSLMNDTALIQGVTKKLLKIVEIIFTHSNQNDDFEVIKNSIKIS
ncbi:Na+/Pi-cotransporter [Campylobacter hyointestinalis subsp. hyointestinalis]|uniref:Na+/Pi-cotransporter n=2 Tax=Campylobacter hyointestinalis TaxID=198 RepID=A0A0S4SPC8_CAMHY|nr:sodium:phosphate symporter [Campylobacter hyointestinalis subsp. hyointestinalis]PPB62131.1 sodium:phosphate symporter [Campylobacter hyointestinalis subsp. hyointestinalis]PPB62660.1 sodium:phosphate symporter [Campylobacter hyointestinalis subsp. hyointestinalis]CUU86271.1 Na+/Pi-cotransporter [Campylobacter hyointestinalis subsp. hyointestinalis]CUU87363.1 Na+/Pi-cotransporter [Campylobacter hyointestinalis subsp. hyointestinalis]